MCEIDYPNEMIFLWRTHDPKQSRFHEQNIHKNVIHEF
jgi:hypothetical protein